MTEDNQTTIIDGKQQAADFREKLAKQVHDLAVKPGLAVILVGEDPASAVYVRNKITACEKTGIISYEHKLEQNVQKEEIASLIQTLNNDPNVHGILLQLPLPDHLSSCQEELVQSISPEKDVDGLTTINAGRLMLGDQGGFVPCTPQGALHLILSVESDLTGMHAVVIGRSNLFGKPMGQLLLAQNCTVTQCHSRTKDLPEHCRRADILIAAVGRAQMVKEEWVKPGAIVIDVGINRTEEGKLVGDVDYQALKSKCKAITPVPGGVGPMTIAYLLANTLKASELSD